MNKKLKVGMGIAAVIIAAIIVFFAVRGCSKEATYTVTFDSNGGTTVSSQTVEKDGVVKEPSNPTKNGYSFGGWYIDLGRNEKYNFSEKVTKDFTLTAKWDKTGDEKEFTVTFGGDGVTSKTQKVIEGQKLEKPADPTRTGYKFLGWYNGSAKYDFDSVVTGDVKLTAKWEAEEKQEEKPTKPTNGSSSNNTQKPTTDPKPVNPTPTPEVKKYTVKFDTKGGSAVASQTVEEGASATKPTDPTRNGYVFDGWTLNGSIYNFGAVNSDITVVANWKEVLTFTYSVEGLMGTPNSKVRVCLKGNNISNAVTVVNSSNKPLGRYDAGQGGVMVSNTNLGSISKVKYNGEYYTVSLGTCN